MISLTLVPLSLILHFLLFLYTTISQLASSVLIVSYKLNQFLVLQMGQ